MRFLAWFSLVLAGCGGPHASPQPPAPPSASTPALPATTEPPSTETSASQSAPSAPPASTEPPKEAPARVEPVIFDPEPASLKMEDLPALSEDGRHVAIRYEHGDGLRGFPNRELMVIDVVSDTITKRIHVLDADEVNNPTAPPSSDAEWVQREHEANAYLAKRRWRKLAAYPMSEDLTASDKLKERVIAQVQEASGEGLRVRFHEPNLFLEIDRKPAVGRAYPSWIMRPFRPCSRCDICPSQVARINTVFGNRRRGILLIELNHTSNSDMCTEDRPVWHVVPLPKLGP